MKHFARSGRSIQPCHLPDPVNFAFSPQNGDLRDDSPFVVSSDGFPISPGHTPILLDGTSAPFFLATADGHIALASAVQVTRELPDQRYRADGYNIGPNQGGAVGQAVGLLHIALIPSYVGDIGDPRGGVRWVLPTQASYSK